jgi:hypothetical protein
METTLPTVLNLLMKKLHNIMMNLKNIGYNGGKWMKLAQDCVQLAVAVWY